VLRLLWLIPLLPFLGFVVNGLLGARVLSRRAVGVVACSAVLLAFLLSLGAVFSLGSLPASSGSLVIDPHAHRVTQTLYTWMPLGEGASGQMVSVDWAYVLDPLSAVMLLVVTGVGFLIHVYSMGYMEHEPRSGYARFFAYLNLFMGMMLTLVLGGSLPVVFVGWEGVGLCSYLLIGYYYDRMFDEKTQMSCADAGRKAFLVNRVGDMGFMLGMLLLLSQTGTLSIQGVLEQVGSLGPTVCTVVGLLLFVGACGKSAQIPLYVWLPDAMAGPTPVSALIHAATMVTAGVYVLCRMAPLYVMAPTALLVVAVVGGVTAVFAASMGLAQTDIKKVLAYSTVSQLGYMVLAVGVGAFSAAMFHLMTHAFFKALLFLGAGSVIHALSGEQDIRKMGGLKARLPWTHLTFLVATLAIAGIPPLAGFFSKDEILWKAFVRHPAFWAVGAAAAFMTAFYMTRLYILTFLGPERFSEEARHHLHESPPAMTVPLRVLAVLSVVGGWVGIPAVISLGLPNVFEHYLAPVLPEGAGAGAHEAAGHGAAAAHGGGLEIGLMAVSVLVALAGILLGWLLYVKRPELPEAIATRARGLYRLVYNKYFVDELYDRIILRPYGALCRAAAAVDERIVDGLVNAAGFATDLSGEMLRLVQSGYVRQYALGFFVGTVVILYVVLR
jgi:NADH-quinone oxidoreductase subunit L